MKMDEGIALFRRRAKDKIAPFLFATVDIKDWFAEAQREACRRMDLLAESIEPDLCSIDVSIGDAVLELSPLWTRITYAAFLPAVSADNPDPRVTKLELVVDRQVIDRRRGSSWRTTSADPAMLLIENRRARFDCLPQAAGALLLEGFRFPFDNFDDSHELEIDPVHHTQLVDWALFRAFEIPDSETIDKTKSADALARFNAYFGLPRDGRLLQDSEAAPFNVGYF